MPGAENNYSHERRDETATPLCGAHRSGGTIFPHKNALLVKPQLGTVKATCYDLPSKANLQHEYGLPQMRDGSSSAEVLGNWAQSEPNPNVVPGRDFKMLNKHAISEGGVTCKDMSTYRATNDFRLKLGSEKPPERKPYDETTSFGRPTNASTSFNDLFSHSYRYDWVAESTPAADVAAAKNPQKPTMTKSAIALAQAAQSKMRDEEPAPLWKMSAFASVPPKIGHQG